MYEDQEQIEIARGEGDGEQKSMANFDGIDQSIVAETSDKMKERERERESERGSVYFFKGGKFLHFRFAQKCGRKRTGSIVANDRLDSDVCRRW